MTDLITLVGTIVDHEGATPLAGARITATPSQRVTQTSDGEEALSDASATTDETGAFTLPLVYAEGLRYTIVYRAGGERLMRGVLDCDSYTAGATVDVADLPPIAGIPPTAVETLQAWFLAQLEALGEGGAVVSVNGQGGVVVLDASDVGALPDTYAPTWGDITGKPTNFPPSTHNHPISDIDATGTADSTTYLRGDGTWATPAGGGGGVTDHGALTGLGDDDHTQYHTDARGDARYYTKGQVDALVSGATPVSSGGAGLPRALSQVHMALANAETTPAKILFAGSSSVAANVFPARTIKRLHWSHLPGATVVDPLPNSTDPGTLTVPASGIYSVNMGAGATSSTNWVHAGLLTAATNMQPHVVIHSIGMNDLMGSRTLGQFETNIGAGLNAIDAVVTIPPVHLFVWFYSIYATKPRTSDDYIGALISMASARPATMAVLDLGPYADTVGVNQDDPWSLDTGDGLHMTDAGGRMWGDLLATAILTGSPAWNVVGYSTPGEGSPWGATTTTTTTEATTTTTTTEATTTTTTTGGGVTTVTDDFNRADSAAGLGTSTSGHTWEQIGTGIVGISSNQAYRVSNGAMAVIDFGQADMVAEVETGGTGGFWRGPVARVVDSDTFYSVDTSSNTAKIAEYIGGSIVGTTATYPFADGDTLALSCKEVGGSTVVDLLVNGVVVRTLTSTAAGRPNGTKGGLRPFNSTTARYDNFSITSPA